MSSTDRDYLRMLNDLATEEYMLGNVEKGAERRAFYWAEAARLGLDLNGEP